MTVTLLESNPKVQTPVLFAFGCADYTYSIFIVMPCSQEAVVMITSRGGRPPTPALIEKGGQKITTTSTKNHLEYAQRRFIHI
jgi:hypothetical protein